MIINTLNAPCTIESATLIRRDNNGNGLYLVLAVKEATQLAPFIVSTMWEGATEWNSGVYHQTKKDAYNTYVGKLTFYALNR